MIQVLKCSDLVLNDRDIYYIDEFDKVGCAI